MWLYSFTIRFDAIIDLTKQRGVVEDVGHHKDHYNHSMLTTETDMSDLIGPIEVFTAKLVHWRVTCQQRTPSPQRWGRRQFKECRWLSFFSALAHHLPPQYFLTFLVCKKVMDVEWIDSFLINSNSDHLRWTIDIIVIYFLAQHWWIAISIFWRFWIFWRTQANLKIDARMLAENIKLKSAGS